MPTVIELFAWIEESKSSIRYNQATHLWNVENMYGQYSDRLMKNALIKAENMWNWHRKKDV